jgi:hypothetical protein
MPMMIEDNPFAECDGAAELFVALYRLNGGGDDGVAAVKTLIFMVGYPRHYMRETATELRTMGLADLAAAVAECAKTAPQRAQTFATRAAARLRKQRRLSPLSPRAISSSARATRKPLVS